MFDVDWMGLLLPSAYVVMLFGSLYTFSSIYRKRKASQSANLAPWFPPHLQRNIYLSLLHLESEDGKEKAPNVPQSVLRAALLRRAVEDIHRIIQIRTAKQACATLLARGSVGDDLWQRFQRAEKEMEEELRDVVMEANGLVNNWGQIIFQSANEIAANTMLRKRLDEIQTKTAEEKEWWEKRRESIRGEFMKELDINESANTSTHGAKTPVKTAPSTTSSEDGVLVDASTPVSTPGGGKKKKGRK